MINELPDNPDQLIQKSYKSRDFAGRTNDDGSIPFALQTDDNKQPGHNAWLYY
jgi:hypothetical protein